MVKSLQTWVSSPTAKVSSLFTLSFFALTPSSVVVKNPSDFIGSALGQSESQTKAILASTVGKVLVIDEVARMRQC
jgi:hypothetical protein